MDLTNTIAVHASLVLGLGIEQVTKYLKPTFKHEFYLSIQMVRWNSVHFIQVKVFMEVLGPVGVLGIVYELHNIHRHDLDGHAVQVA